jgi:uncharacterized protein YcaQ
MTTPPLTLSLTTARRAILGRQGLWPGRRWIGRNGVAAALESIEALQLDPLVAVARSHDIALQGRVLDYQPEWLYEVAYGERRGFDYGTLLHIYPMAELPHWHATHIANRQVGPHRQQFAAENGAVLDQVRAILREEGAVTNRQLTGNARVDSYRGRKDTALALYHLWLTGEVMITGRNGFDRLYDLAERVASADLRRPTPDPAEAERHFARKVAAFHGIIRESAWIAEMRYYLQRPIGRKEGQAWIDRLIAEGVLLPVAVAGWKDRCLAPAEDRPILETLAAGKIPAAWEPAGPTTQDEATLLAPLEIVSARGVRRSCLILITSGKCTNRPISAAGDITCCRCCTVTGWWHGSI